jgi:hypothetical protein
MHQAVLELKIMDFRADMTNQIFRNGGDQSCGLEEFYLLGYCGVS